MKKNIYVPIVIILISLGFWYFAIDQRMNIKQSDILLTIDNSGSTNNLGYEIVISKNGSVLINIKDKKIRQIKPKTEHIDISTLSNLLEKVGDVSLLTSGVCFSSSSFGTSTSITYKGKTSGDISCSPSNNWPKLGYILRNLVFDLNNNLVDYKRLSRNSFSL